MSAGETPARPGHDGLGLSLIASRKSPGPAYRSRLVPAAEGQPVSDNGSADQAQSQGYQQCSMVVPAQGVVVPTVPYRSSTVATDSWTQQLQVESTTNQILAGYL